VDNQTGQNLVYMAYDGDNAGRLCGRSILANNVQGLHEVSQRIQLGHEIVKRWVESHGGEFISGGGDEGVFSIPSQAIDATEELRADYKYATNLTATIGIGNTLSEAGKAMLVGKFRGKNTIVRYTPEIEQEIRQAQSHISQGIGNAEEKKIGEAYLQDEGTVSTMMNQNKAEGDNSSNDNIPSHDDCPYCAESSAANIQDPDHCKYCHDMDAESDCPYCHDAAAPGHADDCPYCAEAANHDPSAPGHQDDCPYCQDMGSSAQPPEGNDSHETEPPGANSSHVVEPTAGPTIENPTTTDSENYIGQDLNTPDLPKPDAIQQYPDGLGVTMDTPTNENVKLDVAGQGSHQINPTGVQNETLTQDSGGSDPQSEETIQDIAQEINAQPSTSNPEAQTVKDVDGANTVDATDSATGTTMEGNVSRPDGYDDPSHPQDMGLAEEDEGQTPDITGVMQEGLDGHADNINREKVINLVSEALVGFKACKSILEKSKLQAPQLYESSIAMLKAMIEMAKMLGLDQEAQAPTGEDPLADNPAAATPNSPVNDSSSQNYAQSSAAPKQGDPAAAGVPKYQPSKSAAPKEGAAEDPKKQKGQSANQ